MAKQDLLISLAVERARLMQALLGLSAEELESAPMCGDWSARDILAHVIAWERHVYDEVRYMRARQPIPPDAQVGDPNAYNARAVAVWRTKPLADLLDALAVAHRQLTVGVAGCSQAQLDQERAGEGGRMSIVDLVLTIVDHDVEHTGQILERRRRYRPDEAGPKPLLQHALNASRSAFMTLVDVVPVDQRQTLAVNGTWTLKDVVGHIADWDQVVVEVTLAMEANQRITWEPIDYGEGWNQSHAAERRGQSWNRVWQDFIDDRGTVVTELAERVLEPDLARMLPSPWGDMSFYTLLAIPCRHDMDHVEPLLAWYKS